MDERGVVGLYIAVAFTAVILITGLIVDGGAIRAGRRDVGDVAGRAARAGAQEIDVDVLMGTGGIELDSTLAAGAAKAVLTTEGRQGVVTVDFDRVTVTVEADVSMRFLSAVGVGDRTVVATRTARAAEGVVSG